MFHKLDKKNVDTTTLLFTPGRSYKSSSAGETGSVRVVADASSINKETGNNPVFVDSTFLESSLESVRASAFSADGIPTLTNPNPNIFAKASQYISKSNSIAEYTGNSKTISPRRFIPSYTYTKDTSAKIAVKDLYFPHYRSVNSSYQWNTVNYNSLNFFTASTVESGTAILFPSPSSSYTPLDAFTIDFYIKPTVIPGSESIAYRPGTIMHLSSTYAVSLHTGSAKNENGLSTFFKLSLQLSHSADILPSVLATGSYPNNLVFFSNDNILKKDYWHHVCIRWGTTAINDGTGTFYVDGSPAGIFVIPSSSIAPADSINIKNVLSIGNFYEGKNVYSFFSNDVSQREGLYELDSTGGIEVPSGTWRFSHPLNAEVHDISIRKKFLTDYELTSSMTSSNIDDRSFYLPPFFTQDSPERNYYGTHGGVLISPFATRNGTTEDPFSLELSFGCGAHFLNLENYVKDFASGRFGRLLGLSGSVTPVTSSAKSANEFLNEQKSVVKRNLTLLPCDDGNFIPKWDVLKNETKRDKFTDFMGAESVSVINLDNLVSSSFYSSALSETGSIFNELAGATPENFEVSADAASYTIYQRTKDASSNEVVFFDISSVYYGHQIQPGTFVCRDEALTGSSGAMQMTLRDDGAGGLYRQDCSSSVASWNNVGNILYAEGIAVVKTPLIPYFGKENFSMSFNGNTTAHVVRVNTIAPAGATNFSNNPSFTEFMSASSDANIDNQKFAFIDGFNIHDKNLNVVAKSKLAQPILKKDTDKILLRMKLDF